MRFLFCSLYLSILNTVITENTIETALLKTSLGSIKGIKGVFAETGDTLYEFRGIPFGKPPVGSLRFKKPVPFGLWNETLDGTAFRSACPQNIPDFMPELSRPSTSEDCLFLNVYVPNSLDKLNNFSVMVWIHGGGFEVGFGNEEDLLRMAIEGDVIMVSFNYRLGIFGFLAIGHPAARGNYALWDQKLALQWVHDNIEMFGGNPNSVTIFGESAGGYSVSLQSLISSNNGLFHRAIAQSGVHSKILMRKQDEVQEYANQLSKKSMCPLGNEYKFVDCLRQKQVQELLEIADFYPTVSEDKLKRHIFFKSHSYPIVDGELFTENPIVSLEDKTSAVSQFFGSLDFISGTTSNEGSLLYLISFPELQEFYRFNVTEGVPHKVACEAIIAPYVEKYLRGDGSIKEQMCNFYKADASTREQSLRATELLADVMFTYPSIKMLEFHAALKNGKTYQYLFSKTSPDPFGGTPPEWFEGCGHGDDLIWLFKVGDHEISDDEKQFSKNLIQYWTSFAKSGRPIGGPESMFWIPFDLSGRMYLNFDIPTVLQSFYKMETSELWSDIYTLIEIYNNREEHDEL
ncbi:fatty acyl-CoA hydrolase precursor, medium chain-like [Mytilus galloprovincialis]|uniref:fatty acyl-CoA hydrolase precursor, medium chain-like n=1 Tax=Mytilus galloprovincialis TaxID=29158 RepID=UPI003F7C65C3